MKAVAFVCLLSLSLCLGQPTSQPDVHSTQAATVKTDDKATPAKHETSEQSTVATVVKVVTLSTEKPTEHTEQAAPSPSPNDTKPTDGKAQGNKTEKTTEKEAPKPNDSKPDESAKKDAKEKPAEEAKSTEAPKTTEGSKAAGNTTTAAVPVTEKTTEIPKDTTEKPLVGKRGFDGPSFIGGIILTLGLLAIGFMGFKYYKNQTERNYHTL